MLRHRRNRRLSPCCRGGDARTIVHLTSSQKVLSRQRCVVALADDRPVWAAAGRPPGTFGSNRPQLGVVRRRERTPNLIGRESALADLGEALRGVGVDRSLLLV